MRNLSSVTETKDIATKEYVDNNSSSYSAGSGISISNNTISVDTSVVEVKTNKVTSLSSISTDTQYPSAKCVYDLVGDIETILTTLDVGSGI